MYRQYKHLVLLSNAHHAKRKRLNRLGFSWASVNAPHATLLNGRAAFDPTEHNDKCDN